MKTLQQHIEDAFAYHRIGELDKAESIYDQLLGQIPQAEPNLFFGYGTLLVSKQKYGLGIGLLQGALNLFPPEKCAPVWTNLACAYKHLGKDELSLAAYEKALALEPNQPDILAGISGYWINKNAPEKVVEYASKALVLDPNHSAAHMHLGLGYLEQGKFDEAWPHYEHRWDTVERIKDKRPYKAPVWDGKKVHRLAIHGEQGLGDEILFMSLWPKVRHMADFIAIECADRLVHTFKDSFNVPCYPDHKSLIEGFGEPDACIAMASLPKLLGLPDGKPFLNRYKTRHSSKPLVGIAWRGGTVRTNIWDRTLKIEDFVPILATEGVEFCSVQYGSDLENELTPHGLEPHGGLSFDELQQRIANCDLVISVCQTAVHQAGAMGVECWVLTPQHAAWRYRGDRMMPFYESVKFFRQGDNKDWEFAIQNVAKALREKYAALAA